MVNVVDALTGMFIVRGESNPIFLVSGSVVYMVLFKFAIIYGIWYFMRRGIYPSHFYYFMFIMILLLGSLAVGVGVYSNMLGLLNPQILQTASEMTTAQRVQGYSIMITIFYIAPMALCLIGFKLYDSSCKDVIFNKEYFKRKRWWQV